MTSSFVTCPKCGCSLSIIEARKIQPTIPASSIADLGDLLNSIDITSDALAGQEVTFVGELRERYAKYGENTRMSEKQMSWLRKIAAKGF